MRRICAREQLFRRRLLPRGQEHLNAFPAVVVQDARQVGKSTFAQMLVESQPHVRLSLDEKAKDQRLDVLTYNNTSFFDILEGMDRVGLGDIIERYGW